MKILKFQEVIAAFQERLEESESGGIPKPFVAASKDYYVVSTIRIVRNRLNLLSRKTCSNQCSTLSDHCRVVINPSLDKDQIIAQYYNQAHAVKSET